MWHQALTAVPLAYSKYESSSAKLSYSSQSAVSKVNSLFARVVSKLLCLFGWNYIGKENLSNFPHLPLPATYPNRLLPIFEAFIWHLVIRCLFQFCTALFCGLVVYPLLSLTITLFGLLRWCLRSTWDAIVYHFYLKWCIRIPARNNSILKRRAGPGISPKHFYKVNLSNFNF